MLLYSLLSLAADATELASGEEAEAEAEVEAEGEAETEAQSVSCCW